MAIKNDDFIEIEYTAKVKDTNEIFDTTDEKTAKDAGIYEKGQRFGAVVICIGQGFLLKGLENELVGKEVGKEYEIPLGTDNAFGRKSAKLIQLVATNKFKVQGIMPQPGLQITIDGMFGTIKTVTGGRTLIDFNHPLAGQDVVYTVKILKHITNAKEKADGLVALQMGQENASTELNGEELIIRTKLEAGEDYKEKFSELITKLVPEIKKVSFVKEQAAQKEHDAKPAQKE